ncbi:MAG TPA: FtsX-like permease family protein [Opitutaceae bacterium]|nr:FtsX-like permease family protein [Opitutaceae bacterium]
MSPNLHIAFRFLTAKKRAMLMSLSCTVLGVSLFIITQATTSGFKNFFIRTIIGTDGAMRIQDKIQNMRWFMTAGGGSDFDLRQREGRKYIEGVEEPDRMIKALRNFPNISGISPVLRGNVEVRSSFKNDSAQVYGIELSEHLKVSDLGKQVVGGTIDDFRGTPAGALVGRELADRLQLELDDRILIESHGNPPHGFRVAAIYETGVSEIDRARIYIHMGDARSLLRKPTGVSFIQLNLFDIYRAPADAEQITEVLAHSAKPWQVREKPWLEAFSALGISSAITVSVFTLIAGLAMFNTLAMIVLEKTKDIAILRSMGYERSDITRIFLWQAIIVLLIGTVIGSLLGWLGSYAVSRIPIDITGIFATKYFLVALSPWHFVQAIATAVVTVMIASLIPARRAARLEPGDIVRGTAQ